MTLTQLLVIVIIIVPLFLAVTNRIRTDVAALTIALLFGAAQALGLGVLDTPNTPQSATQAISGFGQPVVVTLVSLFIVTRALDKFGFTRWLARRIVRFSGQSEARIVLLFTLAAAGFSLFMNNVAAGALLLPSAIDAARRSGIKASRLLMPISFGTLVGGMATYFTTANIIVDGLLNVAEPPQDTLNILSFTPVGGLIAVLGIGFIATFGRRLLPERAPLTEQILPNRTGSEMEEAYLLHERLWEARVLPSSRYANCTLAESGIGERFGLSVVAIWHGRQAIFTPTADQIIRPGDILLIVGREDRVLQLTEQGMVIGRDNNPNHISERGVSFIEVVLAPHSNAQGQTLKQLNFRKKFDFTAVALWREGRSYRTDVADLNLRFGDALLLVGPRTSLRKMQHSRDFISLESDVSDQPLQPRPAAIALLLTIGAVGLSVLGAPTSLCMLAAALLIVVFKLMTMEEAYRAVEWQVIFLVAGMYAISIAMQETGLAEFVGQGIVAVAEPYGSLGLAAGSFMLSALLTHLMGGQVTALVTGPIAITAAIQLNTSPQAIAVATAIGCSAAFLTPIAHPVNVMMMGSGNYQFSDFIRLGLPMMILTFIGLLVGMVLFWGL